LAKQSGPETRDGGRDWQARVSTVIISRQPDYRFTAETINQARPVKYLESAACKKRQTGDDRWLVLSY